MIDLLKHIDREGANDLIKQLGCELIKGVDLSSPRLKDAPAAVNSLRLNPEMDGITCDHPEVLFLLEYGDLDIPPFMFRSRLEERLMASINQELDVVIQSLI